jgi:sec-independent protein translocase protein TatA
MVAYSPGPEWIVVAVVLILLFGAKKLPELARSVGKSTSEFKKGMSEGAAETPEDSSSEEAGTSDDTEHKAERKAETAE